MEEEAEPCERRHHNCHDNYWNFEAPDCDSCPDYNQAKQKTECHDKAVHDYFGQKWSCPNPLEYASFAPGKARAPTWSGEPDTSVEVELCDPDNYQAGRNTIKPPLGNAPHAVYTGAAAIEGSGEDFEWIQCPAHKTLGSNPIPWTINYKYKLETCTTTSVTMQTALANGFAFSSYAEMLVTVLCVVLFQKLGIMYMKKKVGMSLLLSDDQDPNDKELERELNALKTEHNALKEQVELLKRKMNQT